MKTTILKSVIVAAEIILSGLFWAAFPVFNVGNVAALLFCGLLILATVFSSQLGGALKSIAGHRVGVAVLAAVGVLFVAAVVYVTVLSVKMYSQQKNEPDEPELLIVLGCKVRGTRPTRMLRRRCDAAVTAMNAHPDVLCVVSGGQGRGEDISEAEAMKRYLTSYGIDESRIIMEDKSTSTAENIRFSFDITDRLGLGRDITIVTDGYHQYRASLIAKKNGAESVTAYSADTEARFIPTYWVREWFGLTHFYILGR
ncbi:MAG: YdcF family protein [Ruminococcus sp.]|nr:YdcF family protein [Ruminococcus sp.]